jgi:homoserine acetyltransferase
MPKIEDLKMGDDYQTYKLGNFELKSGGEITDAFIAYKTLGDPKLPAIIYPTWYSGCTYQQPHLQYSSLT